MTGFGSIVALAAYVATIESSVLQVSAKATLSSANHLGIQLYLTLNSTHLKISDFKRLRKRRGTFFFI